MGDVLLDMWNQSFKNMTLTLKGLPSSANNEYVKITLI